MTRNKNTGATVHWIDKDGFIQYSHISPHHLRGSANYRSEAMHITNCAEHMEVIMDYSAGESAEKDALERLKLKADEIRNAIAGRVVTS